MNTRHQRGVTLIELIVAIVVIAIGITSILGLLSAQASHSGDAMIAAQATHIANAYLNEVIQKSYAPLANPAGRQNFNDVDDYPNGLSNGSSDIGVHDQFNNPVTGLNAFNVSISVTPTTLGTVTVKRIDVTVTYVNTGLTMLTTGYKAQ